MKKLTKKWQLFVYATAGMGVNMLNLMMNSYLCSALLKGGFTGDALKYQTYIGDDLVIAGVWVVFAFVAKLIDGFIDIPMASFTDRLRTRWGRRRPSLMIGFIPLVIFYALFLIIPHREGISMLNTVFYGIILCGYYTCYTLTMVTYYATFTEIVSTEAERGVISYVKSFCDIVYYILGYVVVRGMLNSHNVRTVALFVLPLALTMLIPMFMIKEPSNLKGDMEEEVAPKLIPSLVFTFKNKTFILWMIVYAFMTFGVQLFLGGINEYFATTGMNMMFVMMASFAPVPFTLLIFNALMKKKGFVFAFRYTLIMYSIGMLMMFGISFLRDIAPKNVYTVCAIVTGLVNSLSIGSMFSVAYSIPAQIAADEEKETGKSHSAMFFAVQGLLAGVASGLATGPTLVALKEGSKNVAEGRTPIWYMTVICAIATLLSLALTVFLPKSLRELGKQEKKEK